jgi:hypothetical protein
MATRHKKYYRPTVKASRGTSRTSLRAGERTVLVSTSAKEAKEALTYEGGGWPAIGLRGMEGAGGSSNLNEGVKLRVSISDKDYQDALATFKRGFGWPVVGVRKAFKASTTKRKRASLRAAVNEPEYTKAWLEEIYNLTGALGGKLQHAVDQLAKFSEDPKVKAWAKRYQAALRNMGREAGDMARSMKQ